MVKRDARRLILIPLILFCGSAAYGRDLPQGFGKVRWGMGPAEVMKAYNLALVPPASPEGTGPWAVIGPGPDEVTASGAALGDNQLRSVSFGFHPEKGLGAVHVRFSDALRALSFPDALKKIEQQYGPPDRIESGSKAIWEDGRTHLEFTYHRVSQTKPTPKDHFALVVWDRSIADFSEEEHEEGFHPPPEQPPAAD